MDGTRWERLRDAFAHLHDASPDERAAGLAGIGRTDPELRAELEAMLASDHDDRALRIERTVLGERLARKLAGGAPEGAAVSREGTLVGAWRLLRPIGHGGMGEVWLAERADGSFEQRVAVKLMRAGWRSPGLAARFHRERQLLARLSHPHVATLHDGGVTDDGIPYLVMEWVDGEPITAWCDANGLGVRERLRLFAVVCETVRFAHEHLVVHRDLKPPNILVTPEGRPVLLDFGIAKLLDEGDADTQATREGDRLLTPERAAPEQIRGQPVTTATDVWALGVLLFELLTGSLPFDVAGLDVAALERVVGQTDPPRPSRVAPAGRTRALRGDLDQIVATALRADPERRYRSAGELKDDIDAHLRGLPVRARADTIRYRTAKFVRRHRAASLATLAFAVLLMASAGSWWRQAKLIARERDRAVAARESAEQVSDVLVDLLRIGDPNVHPGGDTLRVEDLVRIGEERVEGLSDAPAARVKLWRTFADLHAARSRYREERALLDRALAEAREADLQDEVLDLSLQRAVNVQRLDGAAAAEPMLRASLAAMEVRYGPDADELAAPVRELAACVPDADESRALLERLLRIVQKHHPENSIPRAEAWNALGTHHFRAGAMREAGDAFGEALRILERVKGPDHPYALTVRNNVAVCLQAFGDFAAAEAEYRRLVEIRRELLGEETQGVSTARLNLGVLLAHEGRYGEAHEQFREAHRISAGIVGETNLATLWILADDGVALMRDGKVPAGLALVDSAVAAVTATLGADDAETLSLTAGRDLALLSVGAPVDLAGIERRAAVTAKRYPDVVRLARRTDLLLGTAILAQAPDRAAEAVRAFERLAARLDEARSREHPERSQAVAAVAVARAAADLPWDREALAAALPGCDSWGLAQPLLLQRGRQLLSDVRSGE